MHRREMILACAALVFLSTSVWLGLELKGERARSALVNEHAEVAYSPTAVPSRQDANTDGTSTEESVSSVPTSMTPSPQNEGKEFAASLLERLSDPRARLQLHERMKASLRASYPGLAKRVQLSAEESEALLDVLAEYEVDFKIREANCSGDLQCNVAAARERSDRQREDLQAYLGTSKYQRFELYVDSLQERREVGHLQDRLSSTHPLMEPDAERLIAEMAEVRRETTAAASARGESVDCLITIFGGVCSKSARDGADYRSRLESAEQYSQRLRERAARILSPEQLEIFNQIQQDLLSDLRARLRDE